MMATTKLGRIDVKFCETSKKLYPGLSLPKRTKELNKVLERLLFGIKK